jgi:hypothetical protein
MKKLLMVLPLVFFLISCQGPDDSRERSKVIEQLGPRILPSRPAIAKQFDWADFIKPDLVPVNMRVCRSPEGTYMRWDVLVTLQNQGGNKDLSVSEAPVDVYVSFDGSRPYGVDNETGEPLTLEEVDQRLLQDMPDQQWMSVPRAGDFGGVAFTLWYPEGGPGSRYRRIPISFTIMLDQYRGNNPPGGTVDESNEQNNIVTVVIDRYDEINGNTGTYSIGCWYNK